MTEDIEKLLKSQTCTGGKLHSYDYFDDKANPNTRQFQSGYECTICGNILWIPKKESDKDDSDTFRESERRWI